MLTALLHQPSISSVSALTRRSLSPSDPHSRLQPIIASDSSTWPSKFGTLTPTPSILYSALGTTRAAAGGFAAQRLIDYDLNLALARAAHEAGVRIYVLISSAGVSKGSMMGYSKMKGELEEAVSGLGFEKVVLVKPGLLVGKREDKRAPEYALRVVADLMGKIAAPLKDSWAQDADVVGKAAVVAGVMAVEGKAPEGKIWELGMSDIIRYGKTEWKD